MMVNISVNKVSLTADFYCRYSNKKAKPIFFTRKIRIIQEHTNCLVEKTNLHFFPQILVSVDNSKVELTTSADVISDV